MTSKDIAPIGTLQLERLAITDEPPNSKPEAARTPLPASQEPTVQTLRAPSSIWQGHVSDEQHYIDR